MTIRDIIQRHQSEMDPEDIIEWNKLSSDDAPMKYKNQYLSKMIDKYKWRVGRRTKVDFSEHQLKHKEFIGSEGSIYVLKKPDTIIHSVKFITLAGITAVTGDFGNWIFCREFHPNETGEKVSDGYWIEKLEIHSEQKGTEFDPEGTVEEIDQRFKDDFDDGEHDSTMSESEKDYLNELKDLTTENEFDFDIHAYRNMPEGFDYEYVPKAKRTKPHLRCVFDAFEVMCRIKIEESEKYFS